MQIIVGFPKRENAAGIRNILVRSGIEVAGIATTGAQILQCADGLEQGIIISGYKMTDMVYTELRECLPDTFEILLIASADKWRSGLAEGTIGLAMPLKARELIDTVEMMLSSAQKKRKQRLKHRDAKQESQIQEAKELLMSRNQMTEPEAHRYLQKRSMDNGSSLTETAQMVLSIMRI